MAKNLYYIKFYNASKELVSLKVFTSEKEGLKYCKNYRIDTSNLKKAVHHKDLMTTNDAILGEVKYFDMCLRQK